MLAPLKDRSVISSASEPTAPERPPCEIQTEIEDLRLALRESRQRLRQGAWQSTRQITRLNAEVSRLQQLCHRYEQQLEDYASGVAIVELGQSLMRLSENNERLKQAAHRVWLLEKNLDAAHDACQQLAVERDTLAFELHQMKQSLLSEPNHRGE